MFKYGKITVGFLLLVFLSATTQDSPKFSPKLQRFIGAQPVSESISAWIFLADKGKSLSKKLHSAEETLTPNAYQRRLRNRGLYNLVDEFDIPVNGDYFREIQQRVLKVRHKSRWLNAVSVEATAGMLTGIAALPFVAKIDLVFKTNLPAPAPLEEISFPGKQSLNKSFTLDYGESFTQNNMINVPLLHDSGLSGEGVIIAMLDAGFNNLQHEALDHLDILATRDFVNNDANVDDEPGQAGSGSHGTYTLSVIGGFQEGRLIGPAYGATFILAKTENTASERNVEEDNWIAAAEWADSLGADIISSSVGYSDFDSGQRSYTPENMDGQTAIVTIGAELAASRGILVVNSAGNEGSNVSPGGNTLVAPGDGANVLTVGAVGSTGLRASFSSIGPTADGRIKPDVAAMGAAVFMASASNTSNYITRNGTSFSCPLTAGSAALILEANPGSTNQQIISALKETANNAQNPDNFLGWGIIDAIAASNLIGSGSILPPVSDELEVLQNFPNPFNGSTTFQYSLPQPGNVKAAVYNIRGQKVQTLLNRFQSSGTRTMIWNPENISSGIYIIVVAANGKVAGQKVVYVR